MSFRITCPGCKTAMKLDDDARGTKVRCENCDKTLNIPDASGKKPKDDDALQEGRKLKNAASKADEEEPTSDEQEEQKPKKKKKKKKKKGGSSMGLLIGGGAAIAVLLIVVVGASAYFMTRPAANPQKAGNEQLAQNKDKKPGGDGAKGVGPGGGDKQPDVKLPPPVPVPVPPNKQERLEDRERKKGGSNIISNVRGAGYRTERRNELRQIGLFFQQYAETTPKSARTKEGFMDYMKRDSKVIWDCLDDGYYTLNPKVDHTSGSSVIAYETDIDRNGMHLAVRGDLSVDYTPPQDLKK
jgi:predicted Zn finger-like uncharacterized protein